MTSPQHKQFVVHASDVDGRGSGRLVFATLNVVDHDGDVTLPGFFGRQYVPMVPTHNWNHVPVGKGLIHESGDQAVMDFTFNLKIAAAVDWYEAIKFDLENPPALQQYSYGFTVQPGGSKRGRLDGREVNFLQPLSDGRPGARVHEVSPVLVGAGIGTRTLSLEGTDAGLDPATWRELEEIAKSVRDADSNDAVAAAYLHYIAHRHGIA